MDRIKKIRELAEILRTLRSQGMKIVHCHGVSDLPHIGHTRCFVPDGVCKIRPAERRQVSVLPDTNPKGYESLIPAFIRAHWRSFVVHHFVTQNSGMMLKKSVTNNHEILS